MDLIASTNNENLFGYNRAFFKTINFSIIKPALQNYINHVTYKKYQFSSIYLFIYYHNITIIKKVSSNINCSYYKIIHKLSLIKKKKKFLITIFDKHLLFILAK